jgi:hypothetical protein
MLEGPDAAVLTDELAEYAVLTNREALAPGSQGWHDDNRATANRMGEIHAWLASHSGVAIS